MISIIIIVTKQTVIPMTQRYFYLTVRYDSFLKQSLPHANDVVSAERIVIGGYQVHQPVDQLAAGSASPDHGSATTGLPVPEHGVLITEQQRAYYPTGSGHWHTGVLRKRNDNDKLKNSECMSKCINTQLYEYNPLCRLQ